MGKADRVFVAIMFLVLVVIVSMAADRLRNPPRPSFEYASDVFAALDDSVCPGDSLEIELTVYGYRNASADLALVAWSIETRGGATVIRPNMADALLFPTGVLEEDTTSVFVYRTDPLPALPPGEYQRRHWGQEWGTTGTSFVTPFVIAEDCERIP